MEKEQIIKIIKNSLKSLKEIDGVLFGLPICEDSDQDRKLHEISINHHLAKYLESNLREYVYEDLFVDIEFNREGIHQKKLDGKGYRPDIIVHNRKSEISKKNILIVECKKKDSNAKDAIKADEKKIKSFLKNEKYKYIYGLQVIYKQKAKIEARFFFKDNDEISSEILIIDE